MYANAGVACRLTQDVAMLEVHPTVEDVFDGATTSVEDYLRQIEEATILTAIQVQHIRGQSITFSSQT